MRGRSSLRFSRGPWFLQSAGSCIGSSSRASPASAPPPHRQRIARRCRQQPRRHLHGHRRRSRPSHRLEPRRRDHSHRGRSIGELAVVSALCRVRFRHCDVRRSGAGRPWQHPRRFLGWPLDRHRPADVDAGAALSAAEHGDLRRLFADHLLAAAGAVRPAQRTDMKSAAARRRWAIVAVAVVVLIVSLVIRSAYYQLVLTQVLLWAVLSLAWNILSSYSRYFSFGHAAFWGLGAYTVTLGMINLDLTPWLGLSLA